MSNARRVVKCPACSLHVVLEPATHTMRHEKPICAEFTRRMEAAGMKPRHEPWAVVLDPSPGNVKDVKL